MRNVDTMKIVCSATSCKYSSEDEDSSNITFISFPNSDTAAAWAHNCGRPDLIVKAMEDLHSNHYICADHIEDRFFISKTNPIIIAQGAVPTIFHTPLPSNFVASQIPKDDRRTKIAADSFRPTELVDVVDSGGPATAAVAFADLCRMCGGCATAGTEIFHDDGPKMGLRDKIILHTPVTVDPQDSMPRKVCSDCCGKLEATHSLVVACLRTDLRLRRLLNATGPAKYDSKFEDLVIACTMEIANETSVKDVESSNESSKIAARPEFSSEIGGEWKETSGDAIAQRVRIPPMSEPIIGNASVSSVEFERRNRDEKLADKRDFDVRESSLGKKVPAIAFDRRCGHCSSRFATRKELQAHIAEIHDDAVLFKCGVCEKTYGKWSSLDVHEATHRHDKPYLCDLCGKSFKHSNNLRGHKRIHLEESKKKRHVCDVCGDAFRSRFHLREHSNHHNGNKPYACENCGKTFYKRIQLRQHRLSHGSNNHACPICGATFNRRGNMNSHIKRHDKTEGTYTCSVCDNKFKSMSELKTHRKQHTERDITDSIRSRNAENIVWRCKICDKSFSKRAIMLIHENTHNDDRARIECSKCGKKLANKSSLRYHEKSVHSNVRPYVCKFCDDGFVSKEAKLIHERIHTGERPYACKICGIGYRCSSNLSQHMKIHSSIRPHVCRYCGKSFARKSALDVHERIHTGVKPFVCQICERTFTRKNDMMKHAKTHRAKTTRCDKCDETFETKNEILKHLKSHEKGSIEDTIEDSFAGGCAEKTEPSESGTTTVNRPNTAEADESVIERN